MSDILALLAVRRAAPPRACYTATHVSVDIEMYFKEHLRPGQIIEVASPEEMLTAAEMLYPSINSGSANEEWVCANGRHMKIGDMAPTHLVHALAKIVREARSGYNWRLNPDNSGRLQMFNPLRKPWRSE